MTRTLFLSGLVAATGAALAFGSYAALAGPGGVAEDVLDGDGPGRGNEHAAVHVPAFDHAEGFGEASQDSDDEGDDVEPAVSDTDGDGEVGEGAEKVAQAIADEFEVDVEEVLALHDDGIGFGAIFHLYALAAAKETDVQTLLDELSNGDGGDGFAFGKLRKDLTDEEREALEEGPKNLGELVSGANHTDGNGLAAGGPSSGESHGNGSGPPSWAKAHGRR